MFLDPRDGRRYTPRRLKRHTPGRRRADRIIQTCAVTVPLVAGEPKDAMSITHAQLRHYTHRVLIIQVLAVLAAAAIGYFRYGAPTTGALLYGGSIAIAGTLILIRATRRAERTGSSPAANAALIYGTAISRLAMAIGLFAAGFAILRPPPLALMLGFIVGQGAQLISTAFVSGKKIWRPKR